MKINAGKLKELIIDSGEDTGLPAFEWDKGNIMIYLSEDKSIRILYTSEDKWRTYRIFQDENIITCTDFITEENIDEVKKEFEKLRSAMANLGVLNE